MRSEQEILEAIEYARKFAEQHDLPILMGICNRAQRVAAIEVLTSQSGLYAEIRSMIAPFAQTTDETQ